MNSPRSDALFLRAGELIPGGVNSPVRAFRAVGGRPLFVARASGARLWDVDGNEFLDYVGSWGPMILGHADPRVAAAIAGAVEGGTSFGAPCPAEVAMAEMIVSLVPSVEMVRMVNSGTEATMSALRLARAWTGREAVIKFDGCYHGHADAFLVRAGSGALTLGVPDSPGVPAAVAGVTWTAPYNNLAAVEGLVRGRPGEVAAVIVEPVAGNMGCVPPSGGFLGGLRDLCTAEGIILIFDEVMTGFRLARGGAQELFGVRPDLTTLGKIIGGGLPVGAYGGRRDLMQMMAPAGPVYQAGTLAGNPVAMAAGLRTLELLVQDPSAYVRLEALGAALEGEMREAARALQVPVTVNRAGSMFTVFFTRGPVTDHASAVHSDTGRFASYFRAMLDEGVYFPPSQFEAAFLSLAHTEADVARTGEAHTRSLRRAFP
ncbi:MAG: glutamate-1-semialdehyde 2,1-aminomutase [Bacteroidota bacterium]